MTNPAVTFQKPCKYRTRNLQQTKWVRASFQKLCKSRVPRSRPFSAALP